MCKHGGSLLRKCGVLVGGYSKSSRLVVVVTSSGFSTTLFYFLPFFTLLCYVCVCVRAVCGLFGCCVLLYITTRSSSTPIWEKTFFPTGIPRWRQRKTTKKKEKFVRLVVAFDSGHSDPPPGRRYIPPCKMFGVSRVRQSTVSH